MIMAQQYLRFPDLKKRNIVNNRMTLSRWVKAGDFPSGVMLGPRTRAWSEEEIEAWEKRRRALGASANGEAGAPGDKVAA